MGECPIPARVKARAIPRVCATCTTSASSHRKPSCSSWPATGTMTMSAGCRRVVSACKHARIAFSQAYTERDFLSLVFAVEPASMMRWSGVREFWEIYERIQREKKPLPRFASADRLLWNRKSDPPAALTALSPSDADIGASLDDVRRLVTELVANETGEFVATNRPNLASVVLLVQVGEVRVLLGGDLEKHNDLDRGWIAVLDCLTDCGQSEIFKVPHHGSEDSDEPRIWDELLTQNPIAVVTPFTLGRHRIPSDADLERLCAHADRVFMTAPSRRDPISPPPAVTKTVEEATKSFESLASDFGHVRLRRKIKAGSQWRVEFFGAAYEVECKAA